MRTKLIIIGIILLLLGGLIGTIGIQHSKIQSLNNSLLVAENNNKAYEMENKNLKDKAMKFQFTVDELKQNEDSLVQKLNATRKQLKIKDKELIDLQYLASVNQKTDSIVFVHDTLFREGVAIDTVLSDK